jgi:ABC-type arginine transport system permease subunit
MMEMAVDVCLPNMLLPPCFVKQDLFTVIQNLTSTPMLASTSPPRSTPLTVKGERTYVMICRGLPMMVTMLLAFGVRIMMIRGVRRVINSQCGFDANVLQFSMLRRLTKWIHHSP